MLGDHDHIFCKHWFELALAKNFRIFVLKETEESGHGPLLVYVLVNAHDFFKLLVVGHIDGID